MENYIVRIYGRDPSDSNRVTGMLESVERETRRPFHSLDALRSMLGMAAPGDLPEADARSPEGTQRAQSRMQGSTRRLDN